VGLGDPKSGLDPDQDQDQESSDQVFRIRLDRIITTAIMSVLWLALR